MSVTRIVAWLAVGGLLTIAGCGKSQDGANTQSAASIKGGAAALSASPSLQPATTKPADNSDPLHPVVLIDTSLGKITVTLDQEKAPLTVRNFLDYVDRGFYDGTIFHQALKDYVVLGGAFTPDLKEKLSGVPIRNEARNGQKNARGTIAMARLPNNVDSATCQFFFNISDNAMLDYQGEKPEAYGYCAFGKITEGLDVVEKIGSTKVQDQGDFERIPVQTVMINSIRRIR